MATVAGALDSSALNVTPSLFDIQSITSAIGSTVNATTYTDPATGNQTITGGSGAVTITSGTFNNSIVLGAGQSIVYSNGVDTVTLSPTGSDTIDVLGKGSDLVLAPTGSAANLVFIGGSNVSSVQGGAGSYTITGGVGGGVFTGGAAGNNSITGGSGAATITGGGNGDTLAGGSGPSLIVAGTGNETLVGGSGTATFNLSIHVTPGAAGAGTTDTIQNFGGSDVFSLGSAAATNYALQTYTLSGGSGSFLLEDGTKVVLQGNATPVTKAQFK